jgi:hypothetical protein
MAGKGAAEKGAKDSVKRRSIQINSETADLLQARAAALGISVAELLGAIAGGKPAAAPQAAKDEAPDADHAPPAAVSPAGQADDAKSAPPDARWREVKAWIDSWGKSNELPRPKLGK